MDAETMTGDTLLSKWWQSDSCRQAFERADKARAERLAKVRRQFAERQEKLRTDVENWKGD